MHRPCYSLVVLLQSIGLCLFPVNSIHCQDSVSNWDSISGTAYGCAKWLRESTALDLCDHCSSLYHAICTDQGVTIAYSSHATEGTDIPWSVAEGRINQPATLVGTGYDSAYDFAMFDGRYYGVARSATDIAHSMAVVAQPGPGTVDLWVGDGPATSLSFDDLDGCLSSDYCFSDYAREANIDPSTGGVTRWEDEASVNGEAEGWVDASASSHEACLDTDDAAETWRQLQVAWARASDVVKVMWHSQWAPVIHHYAANASPTPSFEELFDDDSLLPGLSADSLAYVEEAALIRAAGTVEEMGSRLHEVAQQLRFLAADRIVAKTQLRRLAQREE